MVWWDLSVGGVVCVGVVVGDFCLCLWVRLWVVFSGVCFRCGWFVCWSFLDVVWFLGFGLVGECWCGSVGFWGGVVCFVGLVLLVCGFVGWLLGWVGSVCGVVVAAWVARCLVCGVGVSAVGGWGVGGVWAAGVGCVGVVGGFGVCCLGVGVGGVFFGCCVCMWRCGLLWCFFLSWVWCICARAGL